MPKKKQNKKNKNKKKTHWQKHSFEKSAPMDMSGCMLILIVAHVLTVAFQISFPYEDYYWRWTEQSFEH